MNSVFDNAIWIGSGESVENRAAVVLRKSFPVDKLAEEYKLAISGLGCFEVTVNGELPDDTLLNPAQSQYSISANYRVFDITPLIVPGENEIIVTLGNGFFNESAGVWNWQKASWRNAPMMICSVLADGESVLTSDTSWDVSTDGPITQNSIYCGESYDARKQITAWKKAVEVTCPSKELREQKPPFMRRVNTYAPKSFTKLADGSYVIEAPEMMTGWARIAFAAPEGEEIIINYSENLTADGHVQKTGNGDGLNPEWWKEHVLQEDHFISAGKPFVYEPRFTYKGFRYMQVENYSGTLTPEDIVLFRVANDVKKVGQFTCSNEMFNCLHELEVRTVINNFQGKPTDTPVWEKNGWLGDANVSLPTILYNYDMSGYLKAFLTIMDDCMTEFGIVPVMVPTADWGVENSPVWNSIYVFGIKELLDRYGDIGTAKAFYPHLKQYALDNIEEIKGLGWTWREGALSDWVSPMRDNALPNDKLAPDPSEGAAICATAFVYRMLKAMTEIAKMTGNACDSCIYEEAANTIADAFHKRFYDAETGIYDTGSFTPVSNRTRYRQTSNLLPIAFGLTPKELIPTVMAHLVEDIKAKDYHLDTGSVGTAWILQVLADNGYADVAYKLLCQDTYPSWGHWLVSGDDSAWESWENSTRSKDHYFLGTYDAFFYTHLAGIRDVKDGGKTFTYQPLVDIGLQFVEASYELECGTIVSRVQCLSGSASVDLQIPYGMTANVILPGIQRVLKGGSYHFDLTLKGE